MIHKDLSARRRRGFSLVELAIVLGVIGSIVAGIFVAVNAGLQSSRIRQSTDDIFTLVDSVRTAYGNQFSINGSVETIVPYLETVHALPANILRTYITTCGAATTYFLDTPFHTSTAINGCGSLQVCAWTYGYNMNCGNPGSPSSAQAFAVEYQQVDYGTCLALAAAVSPSSPTGLIDITINGFSARSATGQVSGSSTFATARCLTNTNNIVSFVYLLRAPAS